MYCKNCGKQIDDDSKFCVICGAAQESGTDNVVVPTNDEPVSTDAPIVNDAKIIEQEKNDKKKPNFILVVAIILIAFAIGKFVIAPSFLGDNSSGNNGNNSNGSNNSTSTVSTSNPNYDEIFEDARIVRMSPMYFNMDVAQFAKKTSDGNILCHDFGYKNDIIINHTEVLYVPVSGETEARKSEIEQNIKAQCAKYEALNCCKVTYNMSANYFMVSLEYKDIDKAENYAELYDAGINESNAPASISKTETGLLNDGYVKK